MAIIIVLITSRSLPAPALPGRFSCAVPLRLIRRGAAEQLVDGAAQHGGQQGKSCAGWIPLSGLPLRYGILLDSSLTGNLRLGKPPFLPKFSELKTGSQSR